MTVATDDIIKAATSVARDAAEGRLTPADIERQAVEELSALMLLPADPGTALADLRIEVARRVLAEGGVPADEVAEWLAVQRRRENPDLDAVAAQDVLALPDSPDVPAAVAAVLGVVSPESDVVADGPDPTDNSLPDTIEPQPVIDDGMVTLADGRRVPRRLIAGRGFGVPDDGGLRSI